MSPRPGVGDLTGVPFCPSVCILAVVVAAAATLLASCADLSSPYARHDGPVASVWPTVPTTNSASATAVVRSEPGGATEAGDIGWRDFFLERRLSKVIDLALANNLDLRLAVANVEQARARYRVQDATRRPEVDLAGSATRGRSLGLPTDSLSLQVGLTSYELDFFGRIKNLSDAALHSYLSTSEAARSVRLTLVSEVATAWLTLATDLERVALTEQTADSYRRSLDLTRHRHDLGAATGLSVAQSESTLESARASAAAYRAQVLEDRNALALLVGTEIPESMLPTRALEDDASVLVKLPAGLPARVLEQRPDVQEAEHALQSAQFDVGAARAAFFPTISLTTAAGTSSTALSQLLNRGSGAWSFGPSITLPLFDGGSRQADLDSARAAREGALATYEKTLQTAFREVADALAVRSTLAEQMRAQVAVTRASRTSLQLAEAQYRNGSTSYLDTLEAQRTLYTSQQSEITLRLTEQDNRITLYRSLGGGWKDRT